MILSYGAGAQTNVVPGSDTGFIRAPDSLRVVNGELHDLNDMKHRDSSWEHIEVDVLKVATNVLIVSTFSMESIYAPAPEFIQRLNYRYGYPMQQVVVGEKKVPGQKLILHNCPEELSPTVGKTIHVTAMRVGSSNYNGNTLALWDYGRKPTQDQLRKWQDEEAERQKGIARQVAEQRRVAAEKAATVKKATQDRVLKWHLEQAEKGDSFGLFRMGEHYRDGDGVPRDLDKARDYFTKAIAAGSATAADALSKLNQTSPHY